jgi:hypothetical protein
MHRMLKKRFIITVVDNVCKSKSSFILQFFYLETKIEYLKRFLLKRDQLHNNLSCIAVRQVPIGLHKKINKYIQHIKFHQRALNKRTDTFCMFHTFHYISCLPAT